MGLGWDICQMISNSLCEALKVNYPCFIGINNLYIYITVYLCLMISEVEKTKMSKKMVDTNAEPDLGKMFSFRYTFSQKGKNR